MKNYLILNRNNIEFRSSFNEEGNKISSVLHIVVVNSDGNVFDCLTYLINNLFRKDNNTIVF